ncbi:MAG: hemolysin family protein [Treponema sp.]|nr:hemolysin family protein [Treponema sp.]
MDDSFLQTESLQAASEYAADSHYFFIIAALIVLLCFSAFFSACEMAFSSLNRIKLKNLSVKSKRARLALKMLEVYDKILSTVLIGNNIVNITASALATALFIGLFGAKGVSIATLVMTILLLIFGDISPKALAKETPELIALRNAPLLQFFVFLLTPINILMSGWKKLLMKIFTVKADRSTTEDELLTFVEESRQEGVINIQEEKMIRQVIGFDDLKASDIFTPRIDVTAVPAGAAIEEIDKKFMETGFSRLPVYQDSIDNITGLILFKDFYREVMKGLKTPMDIIKPAVFVTKTIKIAHLFKTLQKKQAHFAVIVDEHGGTLGIVTIEDIIEELVGEIWDEHDEVIEAARKEYDGSFTVFGSVNFKDMLEAINEHGFEEEIPDTTVANWIMENLGRLPKVNEILTWQYLTFKVLKVIKQRVMEVNITVTPNEKNNMGSS